MNDAGSFLTCKMCKGPYEDPRILPCFHTFCFQCLGSCLTDKRRKTRSSSTIKLTCPLCQLEFDLFKKDFDSLKKNSLILKLIALLPILNAPREAECDYREEDLEHFTKLLLEEIHQERSWTWENLKMMNSSFKELEDSAHNARKSIKHFASKAQHERNKRELLDEIDASIKEEEAIIESIRINWIIYLLGLQHYITKIKECKDKDSATDHVKLVLSDSKCFLDNSLDLKNLRRKNLKRIEFLKYPDNSYVLGKLHYNRNVDGSISHVGPDGPVSIASMLKFSRKLRTVAYCNKTSELFLLFSSCKDILILSAESSSKAKLSTSVQEGCLTRNGNVEAFDESNLDRKINAVNLNDPNDCVVCSDYLFISERSNNNLHRISTLKGCQQAKYWNTGSYNNGLSVTPVETILVACNSLRCIVEYAVDGLKLRTIILAHQFLNPRHVLFLPKEFTEKHYQRESQTRASTSHNIGAPSNEEAYYNHFAICLAGGKHEILITDFAGNTISSYSQKSDKLNYPIHLSLIKCNSEPSFVACDRLNRRFLLLDQGLAFLRQLDFVFGSTELVGTRDIFGFEYIETRYKSAFDAGETYRIKCPSKSLLTEEGDLFIVDEDNNSLLKLENFSDQHNFG